MLPVASGLGHKRPADQMWDRTTGYWSLQLRSTDQDAVLARRQQAAKVVLHMPGKVVFMGSI
jgi:hypothetical protein